MTPAAERLMLRMMIMEKLDVTDAYIGYMRKHNNNLEKGRQSLIDNGYEETDEQSLLTPDGRQVLSIYGKRWVRNLKIHTDIVESQLADATRNSAAAERETENKNSSKVIAGSEELAKMLCPKCQDVMQHMTICGSCAAGKAGYRHAYICACGVELFSKEEV